MAEKGRFSREKSSSKAGNARSEVLEGDESTLNSYQPSSHTDDLSSLGYRGIEDQSIASSSVQHSSFSSTLWATKRRSDIPLTIHEGDERNSTHASRHGPSGIHQGSTHSSTSEATMGAANLSHRSLKINHRSLQTFEPLEALRERPIQEADAATASVSRPNSAENQEGASTITFQRTAGTPNLRSSLGLGTVFTAMSADTDNDKLELAPSPESHMEGSRTDQQSNYNLDAEAGLFEGSYVMHDSIGDFARTTDDATQATMESNQQFFEEEKSIESPTHDTVSESIAKDQDGSGIQGRSAKDDATAYTMGSNIQYFGRSTPNSTTAGGKTPSPLSGIVPGSNTSHEESFAAGRIDTRLQQRQSFTDEGTAFTMGSNVQYFGRSTPSTIVGDRSVGGAAGGKSPSPLSGTVSGTKTGQEERQNVYDEGTAFTMGSNVEYFGRSTPSTIGGDRSMSGATGAKSPSPLSGNVFGSKTRQEEALAQDSFDSRIQRQNVYDEGTAFTMGSNVQYFGRSTPSTIGGDRSVGGATGAKIPSPQSSSFFGSKTRQSPSPSLAYSNSREIRTSPEMSSLAGTDFLSFMREKQAGSTLTHSNETDLHSFLDKSNFAARPYASDIQSLAGTEVKLPSPSAVPADDESRGQSQRRSDAEGQSGKDDAKKWDDQSTVRNTRSLDGSSSHLDQSTYNPSVRANGSLKRNERTPSYRGDTSVASSRSNGSLGTTPYMLRPLNVRPRSTAGSEVEVSMDGFLHPSKQEVADDEVTKAYSEAKSYRSQTRSYFYEGEDRGDDFTYVDEGSMHAVPGIRSRMILIAALGVLLGTSLFFASRVGPFYISPQTVVAQEQAASLLRQNRILDQANIPISSGTSSSSGSASGGSNSSGLTSSRTGRPAASGIETIGSSAVVASGSRSASLATQPAVTFTPRLSDIFTSWGTPYGGLGKELPTVWSFELTGGDIVQSVFGKCLGKVQAANGADFDTGNLFSRSWSADTLKVIPVQGQQFVNVDMFSLEGINRAARLQLAQAHVAEVLVSPFLHEMSNVFQSEDPSVQEVKGRLMVVFRDPIRRALNRFEEIRRTQGTDFTLMTYAQSTMYNENSPVTRAILGLSKTDPLNDKMMKTALGFIDSKVFVGLFEEIDKSLSLFEQFLGWHIPADEACHNHVKQEWTTVYSLDDAKYDVTDPLAYNLIVAQHRMDLRVYRHAKTQWNKQLKQLTQAS